MTERSIHEMIECIGILAEHDMVISHQALIEGCGLTEDEIKKLVELAILVRLPRDRYQYDEEALEFVYFY